MLHCTWSHKKYFIVIELLLLTSIAIVWFFLCGNPYFDNIQVSKLRFSNTQAWEEELYKLAIIGSVDAFVTEITLPPPPANSSTLTQAELLALQSLTTQRTKADVASIKQELTIDNFVYDDKPLEEHRSGTASFDNVMPAHLKTVDLAIMYQKLIFDRVRPSFLDDQISLAIPVPNHPAYPSGHATQAYFFAHLLGAENPQRYCQYLTDAARIARNREIAGVHYSSDSDAGRLLAELLFSKLYPQAVIRRYDDCQNHQ